MSTPTQGLGTSVPERSVPPTSRTPFRLVALALAVAAFGAGAPTPIYSLYEQRFHFTSGTLGLVFGAYTVGVLTTMFLLAPLSDTIGRKPVLYLGMALVALSAVAFLLASGVAALALARVVSGLAVGATTSTATASLAGLEPRRDQHHVARVAVAANFGGVAVGILVSGFLAQFAPAPTELVFLILLALSGMGALAVASTPETVLTGDRARTRKLPGIHVPAELRAAFWVSVGGLVACYSIYGLFGALAPSIVRQDLHIPSLATGSVFVAVMFGSAALVQLGLGQVRDRRALLAGFPVILVALVLFVLALPLASSALLLVGAALLGVGVGLAFMGSVTLIDRVAPERLRSGILSGFYLAGYLALAVPTVGVAVLADRFGLLDAGIGFGTALAAFVAYLYLLARRTPTPPGGEGRPRAPGDWSLPRLPWPQRDARQIPTAPKP